MVILGRKNFSDKLKTNLWAEKFTTLGQKWLFMANYKKNHKYSFYDRFSSNL